MPLGRIVVLVSALGLLGLVVALAIGAALILVPLAILFFIGLILYRRHQRLKAQRLYEQVGWR